MKFSPSDAEISEMRNKLKAKKNEAMQSRMHEEGSWRDSMPNLKLPPLDPLVHSTIQEARALETMRSQNMPARDSNKGIRISSLQPSIFQSKIDRRDALKRIKNIRELPKKEEVSRKLQSKEASEILARPGSQYRDQTTFHKGAIKAAHVKKQSKNESLGESFRGEDDGHDGEHDDIDENDGSEEYAVEESKDNEEQSNDEEEYENDD